MHAVGRPWHRPGRGRTGGRRAVWPTGVHGRGSRRTRGTHRGVGGQHDGRGGGHAGKVGKQQSGHRAGRQETVPDGRLQRHARQYDMMTVDGRHT